MKDYYEYIKENNEIRLDGRHGFFMFLKLIDDMKMHFIKTNHFLNVGKYQYFFTTEAIRRKDEFLAYFKECLSLKITCDTAKKIKDERLSFYFGVKDNHMEYGFNDDMKRSIYRTGIFDVNTKYLRSLRSYKCLSLIENVLKNSNISNLNLLQEIKSHLKGWYENKGNLLILNENMIRKTLKRDDIHDEAKNSVELLQKYEKWCEKFKWHNKVYYYIDNEEDNEVDFYIKIKPKKNVEEI